MHIRSALSPTPSHLAGEHILQPTATTQRSAAARKYLRCLHSSSHLRRRGQHKHRRLSNLETLRISPPRAGVGRWGRRCQQSSERLTGRRHAKPPSRTRTSHTHAHYTCSVALAGSPPMKSLFSHTCAGSVRRALDCLRIETVSLTSIACHFTCAVRCACNGSVIYAPNSNPLCLDSGESGALSRRRRSCAVRAAPEVVLL